MLDTLGAGGAACGAPFGFVACPPAGRQAGAAAAEEEAGGKHACMNRPTDGRGLRLPGMKHLVRRVTDRPREVGQFLPFV